MIHNMDEIEELRKKIDDIDENLIDLLNERVKISKLIGDLKTKRKIPVIQTEREKYIYEKIEKRSRLINKKDIRKIWKLIIDVCRKIQL
ncbi:MAG: chorismate mutase [Promethearchaeota archaeon]